MNDYFVTMQHQFHTERIRKEIVRQDGSRARGAAGRTEAAAIARRHGLLD